MPSGLPNVLTGGTAKKTLDRNGTKVPLANISLWALGVNADFLPIRADDIFSLGSQEPNGEHTSATQDLE